LLERLEARAAAGTHFMPPSLLDSQLQLLGSDSTPGSCDGLFMRFGPPPEGHSSTFPTPEQIVSAILAARDEHWS
jgi:hypothetical protein